VNSAALNEAAPDMLEALLAAEPALWILAMEAKGTDAKERHEKVCLAIEKARGLLG
jgi:hypothetical protein